MKKLALFGLLAAAACGPSVKRIAMEPPQAQLKSKGATLTIRASPRDDKEQPVADVQLTWSSSDPSVASIDPSGKVTAVKSGKTVITAKAGEISGTTQLNVSIPTTLVLAPTEVTLSGIGQTTMLQRTVKDDTGSPVVGQIVMFSSSDPNVAAVDQNGNIHAMGGGTATVTAKTEGLSATTKVTVQLPVFDKIEVKPKGPLKVKTGKGEHLTATPMNAGQAVAGVQVKWTSDKPDIASVTPAGDVQGVKKGKAMLTATAGTKTATVAVIVQ